MEGTRRRLARLLLVITVVIAVAPSAGCVIGLPAQIGYMIWGLKKEAEYDGLKNENVAVIVYSTNAEGTESGIRLLTSKIHYELDNNVKKIKLIPQSEISSYSATNTISEKKLLEIGKGVNADKVLAVRLHSYSLFEGSSLFKGLVSYTVTVYDMTEAGKQVYSSGRVDYDFPRHSGVPQIETTVQTFEARFIDQLGSRIGRLFFDHDAIDTVADEYPLVE